MLNIIISNTTKNRSMNDADSLIGAGIPFRFELIGTAYVLFVDDIDAIRASAAINKGRS
jgi:hypothetical protein